MHSGLRLLVLTIIVQTFGLPGSCATASPSLAQLTNEGQTAYLSHNLETAEQSYLQAARLAEKSPKSLAVILSNLGSVYRDGKKYELAEETFKRALTVAAKGGSVDDTSAVTMKQYAVLLRRIGREFEAIEMEQCAQRRVFPQNIHVNIAARPSGKKPSSDGGVEIPTGEDDSADFVRFTKKNGKDITNTTDGDYHRTVEDLNKLIAANDFDETSWKALAAVQYKQKDYAGAAKTLKLMWSRFPKEPLVPMLLGQCLAKLGKDAEAIEAARHAITMQPDEPELYLFLRGLYARSGQFQQQLDTDREFVQHFPEHEHAPAIEQEVQKYSQEYAQIHSTRLNTEYRWPRGMMPLKVYAPEREQEVPFSESIMESGMTENGSNELIRKAFLDWSQATGGLVKFTYVTNPKLANITCIWSSDASALHSSMAQGETSIERGEDGMPRATVKLLLVDSEGKAISKEEFFETCLHEIGHALGLPHSPNPDDIMFPTANSSKVLTNLSLGDRDRILKMYTQQDNELSK